MEYFNLYPQAQDPICLISMDDILLALFCPFIRIPKIIGDSIHNRDQLTYFELTNYKYQILTNKVLFSALRQFDWKTCHNQFLLFSPNEIFSTISKVYARSPPNCKQSIFKKLSKFF